MSETPTSASEWDPAPLRAADATTNEETEEASRKVCYFYGKTGCRNGSNCKFMHIDDPDAFEMFQRQRVERKKAIKTARRLAQEQYRLEMIESTRRQHEQRLLAAPIFVPQRGGALVPDPHNLETWGSLLPQTVSPPQDPLAHDELDLLIEAFREGRVSPRHSLDAGHPLPCMRFLSRQPCDNELCCHPHYHPPRPLYWRKKQQAVTLLCRENCAVLQDVC